MAEVEVRVKNGDGTPAENALVEFEYNTLGVAQHINKNTDSTGFAKHDIGVQSAEVRIRATKDGIYSAETFVSVSPFGLFVTPPNPQLMTLKLSPIKPIENWFEDLWAVLNTNTQIAILAIGIPFGGILAFLLYKWITSGAFIDTGANVARKAGALRHSKDNNSNGATK